MDKATTAFDSASYWRRRYEMGGNSGRGSYGRLAEFKAEVINDFIAENKVATAIEFGCGDGNQFSLLKVPGYHGVDVSPDAVERCRTRFAGRTDCRFTTLAAFDPSERADLTLSLDVIYHLVEDAVFDAYMSQLFASASRYVIVYASDKDDDGREGVHVRHRPFTRWVAENRPQWRLVSRIANRYPQRWFLRKNRSFCDFFIFERT